MVIFLPSLVGGGAERVQINLIPSFLAAGYKVTLFLQKKTGELLESVPPEVQIVTPGARSTLGCLWPLARYISQHKPEVVLSNLCNNNLIALLAALITGKKARVIVCFHNTLSMELVRCGVFYAWLILKLCKWLLPAASHIIAVSKGVAQDLARAASIPETSITTIYNPVITPDFNIRMQVPITYMPPYILTVGRLAPQKDFSTLIRAFGLIAKETPLQLIILGEGPERAALCKLIEALGIADRVSMPGYLENPFPYIAGAQAFVLSSRYEGFGNVLVEALACGTQTISTNCPHGPAEILEEGKYGWLVRVGDAQALANAMRDALHNPYEKEILKERGNIFSAERAGTAYLKLFNH